MAKKKKKNNEQEYICPCGTKAKDDVHKSYFSHQNVNEKVVLLCWNCADKLHWDTINKEREQGLI